MATSTTPKRGTKAAQDKAAREAKAKAADDAKMQAEMDAQAEARAEVKQSEQAEQTAEIEGANTQAEIDGEKEKRAPRPTTELGAPEKVDALPEISRGAGNGQRQRSQRWVKQLAPVVADPGQWYKVAEFNASSTAGTQSSALRVAARTMSEGGDAKIVLPEFDTAKYELVVLKRGLAIYARLVERTVAEPEAEQADGEQSEPVEGTQPDAEKVDAPPVA